MARCHTSLFGGKKSEVLSVWGAVGFLVEKPFSRPWGHAGSRHTASRCRVWLTCIRHTAWFNAARAPRLMHIKHCTSAYQIIRTLKSQWRVLKNGSVHGAQVKILNHANFTSSLKLSRKKISLTGMSHRIDLI